MLLTVQCVIHFICSCNPLYEADRSVTLSSSISFSTLEYLRHYPSKHSYLFTTYSTCHHSVKIWECTSGARLWDKSIEGTCIEVASTPNADGFFNALGDLVILLVPIRPLWSLQMKTNRKFEIGLLLAIGLMYTYPTLRSP